MKVLMQSNRTSIRDISGPDYTQEELEWVDSGDGQWYYKSTETPIVNWWDSCIFLSHFDGIDGATSTTDISENGSDSPHTINFFRDAQLDTAQKKFGESSLYLDGNDYITITQSTNFNFYDSDFTIDFWFRPAALNDNDGIFTMYGGVTQQRPIQLGTQSAGNIGIGINNGEISFTASAVLSVGTWTHIALVRNGSSFNTYINGTSQANGSTASILDTMDGPITFGRLYHYWDDYYCNGWIDEVRICRKAVWTSNFDVPTEPYAKLVT